MLREERERLARIEAERAERAVAVAPSGGGVPAMEGSTPLADLMAAGSVSPQEEFSRRPKVNWVAEELEKSARERER